MPKRIVVIDDSELVLAIASEALEQAGFEVFTAGSGIEANSIIYSPMRRPDLILLDVMMPMLNGDRKVRLLKEREASRHIPVLLMSTKPAEELEGLARSSGADGFLRKPFTALSLTRRVRQALAETARGAA
ncbi:MAG: two-component system response regulator [Desulfuromonas sp.]|uniref:response regulator n=1 Tax=Desulfuromonas sp. TaxID=892 RepID=UPI000CBC91C1|nr:response regulator [Desulfuromonas sp.]PLX83844.1 MAG: two-component system response regulator [Desulfuromonas sp.]